MILGLNFVSPAPTRQRPPITDEKDVIPRAASCVNCRRAPFPETILDSRQMPGIWGAVDDAETGNYMSNGASITCGLNAPSAILD